MIKRRSGESFKRDRKGSHRVCALFNVLKGAIQNAGQTFVGSLHFIGTQIKNRRWVCKHIKNFEDTNRQIIAWCKWGHVGIYIIFFFLFLWLRLRVSNGSVIEKGWRCISWNYLTYCKFYGVMLLLKWQWPVWWHHHAILLCKYAWLIIGLK